MLQVCLQFCYWAGKTRVHRIDGNVNLNLLVVEIFIIHFVSVVYNKYQKSYWIMEEWSMVLWNVYTKPIHFHNIADYTVQRMYIHMYQKSPFKTMVKFSFFILACGEYGASANCYQWPITHECWCLMCRLKEVTLFCVIIMIIEIIAAIKELI